MSIKLSNKKLEEMLIKMLHTRYFEEKVAYLFSIGMIYGTTHLYIGEEASATGVCAALEPQDLMTSTHRGHGHCISKGMDLNKMMAEMMGKETGNCKGKGGSMHIADLENGNLGSNGIVGGGHCISVGAGLTTKMKKLDRIVVCFFGDGATNEGSFHEAINLASIWELPVLFVCENNQYGMSMSRKRCMNIDDIAVRAASYGIPGKTIDGNDVLGVYEEAKKAREYVRENGPMLLVCHTYRYMGHSKSDTNVYRTEAEINAWKKKDPIKRFKDYLVSNEIFSAERIEALEKQAEKDIEDAVKFAEDSAYPSLDTVTEDVYA